MTDSAVPNLSVEGETLKIPSIPVLKVLASGGNDNINYINYPIFNNDVVGRGKSWGRGNGTQLGENFPVTLPLGCFGPSQPPLIQ